MFSESFVSKKIIDDESDIQRQPINALPNVIEIQWLPSITSEFDIQTDVSPYINIVGGSDQSFNVYTDVSPIIRLGTNSKLIRVLLNVEKRITCIFR